MKIGKPIIIVDINDNSVLHYKYKYFKNHSLEIEVYELIVK